MFEHINELSVLVAALLAAAVGSIWYSPLLFGSLWMKSMGGSFDTRELPKKELLITTVKGVLVHIVFFGVLAEIISVATQSSVSLYTVGVLLVALLGAYLLQGIVWEKRGVAYFLIQMGYLTLSVVGGIGVIAYWPW